MKKMLALAPLIPVAVLLTIVAANGRGGGGHAGGGAPRGGGGAVHMGGGGAPHPMHFAAPMRPAPSISRSPSMSRSLPSRPLYHPQAPAHVQTPAYTRQQINSFVQQSRQHGIAHPTTIQNPNAFKKSFTQSQAVNANSARNVQNYVQKNYPQSRSWFHNQFFSEHGHLPRYQHRGQNWWQGPTWMGINDWLPYDWQQPIYYDDSGAGSYIPEDYGYPEEPEGPEVEEEEGAPPPVAQPPVQQPPPGATEWLPLGVFAAGKTADEASHTNMFLQLAVDKEGEISGTYYNSATDQTEEIDGLVEPDTQKAIWRVIGNEQSPMMTTGIYNLTQDVAPVQMVFPDGTIQQWELVRITQ